MTTKNKLRSMRVTQKELASEAGVAQSCITRYLNGGDVLLSTKKKITAALRRLEQKHQPAAGAKPLEIRLPSAGRRRPDMAQARKMLGLRQADVTIWLTSPETL